jgi:hypothetical protein
MGRERERKEPLNLLLGEVALEQSGGAQPHDCSPLLVLHLREAQNCAFFPIILDVLYCAPGNGVRGLQVKKLAALLLGHRVSEICVPRNFWTGSIAGGWRGKLPDQPQM